MEYEALFDVRPTEAFLLDTHPIEPLVAMRVTIWKNCSTERAAIWDKKTGKLIWAPDDTNAICWRDQGREVLLLREEYARDPDAHNVVLTPLQSEFRLRLERRRWPDQELLSTCELTPPRGWLVQVAASPTELLAAYRWQDQCEAGFDLVDISDQPGQIGDAGYCGPNLLDGPVFSPDGRWLCGAAGEDRYWWTADNEDANSPSDGGRVKVGTLVLGDVKSRRFLEVELEADLPRGWLPLEPEYLESQLIKPPSFLDANTLSLQLASGDRLTASLSSLSSGKTKQLSFGTLKLIAPDARQRAKEVRQAAAEQRLTPIERHNMRMSRLVKDLIAQGFSCPFCGVHSQDFEYHDGSAYDRALIICPSCKRSAGPDVLERGSPGAQRL